ncbi:hypothetical protein, partial [Streptomyces sp. NPDC044948]|uniref:hypothetical protein n=1 Tax=Streptomyces sp. NPDC044948 TaxID=3157092 RepID=UPI0033EACED1
MQGRFKRDGSASAEPEPQGGTGPKAVSSSPQHAQNPGQTQSGDGGERAGQTAGPATPGQQQPAKPAKGSTGPGPRIALRNWRISTRLVSLLALPVVAATSLGALRINQSMDDIQQLDNMMGVGVRVLNGIDPFDLATLLTDPALYAILVAG